MRSHQQRHPQVYKYIHHACSCFLPSILALTLGRNPPFRHMCNSVAKSHTSTHTIAEKEYMHAYIHAYIIHTYIYMHPHTPCMLMFFLSMPHLHWPATALSGICAPSSPQ